jgi:hypothetical protein
MKKHIAVILLIVFITPSIALASWWNPFTWKVFSFNNKKEVPVEIQKIVETKKIEDKIIEKKNLTNDLNNKNNQLQSALAKETTSTAKDKIVDNTTNWRTYTNTTYNYQFKYPKADYYSEKDNTVILDSSDLKNVTVKSKAGYVRASIFSVEVVPGITSAEQLKTLLYSKLSTTDVKVKNVNIGGIAGIELTNDYLINIAGFIKNKQAYIFKSYNEFKLEPYKNLLSSFKFVEPTKITETKIINETPNEIDCGFGADRGVDNSNKELDCFFMNMVSCTKSKIIFGVDNGKEKFGGGYVDNVLVSVNKINNSCVIKSEDYEKIITCEGGLKSEQEKKEMIQSYQGLPSNDKFWIVYGVPMQLAQSVIDGNGNCKKINK